MTGAPSLRKCLAWLHGQIAFKPDHPDWEIIMEIIDRLELEEPPLSNEKLRAIVDQIPMGKAP